MEADKGRAIEPRPGSAGPAGAAEGRIYTDSHAHLEMVAERLGEAAAVEVLARFASAQGGAGPRPLLLDPGVEEGDLLRRARLASRLLEGAAGGASAAGASAFVGGSAGAGASAFAGGSTFADGSAGAGSSEAAGGAPAAAAEPGPPPSLPSWLRFAAGIWPGRPALDDPAASLAALEAAIAEAARAGLRVAAIGECGLDYHHMEADEGRQRLLFRLQIELARRLGLPLIVHTRDAAMATLDELADAPSSIPVLIHCYGYGPEEARAFLAKGCYLSFAGNVTYKKSEPLREALRLVPAERLLLETDAPYMNPEPRRGRPSSPLDVERSYLAAAALRGVEAPELAALVSATAWELFGARS